MNESALTVGKETKTAISALFDNSPPVLVEVRFTGMGTSPDWYLFEEQGEFEQLLERLSTGTELHLSSVWDLKNTKDSICVTRH